MERSTIVVEFGGVVPREELEKMTLQLWDAVPGVRGLYINYKPIFQQATLHPIVEA